MSGRIFQNVVLQLKENTDRTVWCDRWGGHCHRLQRTVHDRPALGGVCTGASTAPTAAMISSDGKTFKALNGLGQPV